MFQMEDSSDSESITFAQMTPLIRSILDQLHGSFLELDMWLRKGGKDGIHFDGEWE